MKLGIDFKKMAKNFVKIEETVEIIKKTKVQATGKKDKSPESWWSKKIAGCHARIVAVERYFQMRCFHLK